MPTATIDGLTTHYEIRGEGFPLLLFSPGGFDARLANWATHGVYRRTGTLAPGGADELGVLGPGPGAEPDTGSEPGG